MSMPDLKLNVLDSPDKMWEFWQWITTRHEYIAVDTETTGLDWWNPAFRVRLIQFGDATSGWSVPFHQWTGLVEGVFSWMSTHRVRAVFHNAAFDLQALRSEKVSVDISIVEDTFVWASLLGFAEDSRQLKSIAVREFGSWAKFGQALLQRGMQNAGWTWETVPMNYPPYIVYGAVDPILTAMYWEKIRPARERFLWHHSLEVATLDITGKMARNGLAVNTNYCIEQGQSFQDRYDAVVAELNKHGIESPGQNAAVGKLLKEAGVLPKVVKLTGTGDISVDKDLLGMVQHPVAKLVLEGRRLNKLHGYLKAMLKAAGGEVDDRVLIHPEIRSIEAKTGRMSVANPALQQLPSPDEDDPESLLVRAAVVPRSEDEVLVGADFGQIELRIFASLTGDTNLQRVLNETDAAKARGDMRNADFFAAMGRDVYHDPSFEKSDPRRRLLKGTTYATMYSAGEAKIAETAKVTQEEISQVLKAMRGRYTAFETLGNELIKNGGRGPYGEPISSVETPTGRRFAVAHRSERRKLINYLVQGHSAEILKMAIQNVRELGWEDNLMLPVHDEIIMSVPREKSQQALDDLTEAMNAVVGQQDYGVAVAASPAAPADNWARLDH